MRVERFSLFFGPMLWKVRRGETEYGIGAIPLGGYVKITGMNPNEEIPPEVVAARLLQPAGLEADRRDPGGPGRQPGDRVRDHLGAVPVQRPGGRDQAGRGRAVARRRRLSVLQRGDRIVSVDGVSGSADAIRTQIATHRCAGAQVNGCLAATPARIVVQRGPASCSRSRSARATSRATRPLSSASGSTRARRPSARARGIADRHRAVVRHQADRLDDRADLRATGAQAAQRRRRRLHRHPGVVRARARRWRSRCSR